MADIRITLSPNQVGAHFRALVRKNRSALVKGLRRGALKSKAFFSASNGPGPKDQGILRAAWFVRNTPDGAVLGNSAPHAGIVERGARPHWAPIEPIMAWVERHANKFTIIESPKMRKPMMGPFKSEKTYKAQARRERDFKAGLADREEEIRNVAQMIVFKIAKRGLKPTYFIRKSIPKLAKMNKIEVEIELLKAAKVGKGE